MSYALYRLHWKINGDNGEITDRYSFHLSEADIAEFIKITRLEYLRKNPEVKLRTEGPGTEVHHVPGEFYDEVKRLRTSKPPKLGVWRDKPTF